MAEAFGYGVAWDADLGGKGGPGVAKPIDGDVGKETMPLLEGLVVAGGRRVVGDGTDAFEGAVELFGQADVADVGVCVFEEVAFASVLFEDGEGFGFDFDAVMTVGFAAIVLQTAVHELGGFE